jgi:uncharacterized Tic20 family protein
MGKGETMGIQGQPYSGQTQCMDEQAQSWAMWCHLASLANFVLPSLGNIIGPLVVWLIARDRHPFIDDQGREALNFQITMTIALWLSALIAGILTCVLIGLLLWPLVGLIWIYSVVMPIVAGLQAKEGGLYRYRYNFRFL